MATVLTTRTIPNETGSTIPANTIPRAFGSPFAEGQIPSGTWPQLQLTDTTPVPATIYQPNYWPDGSMKECCFIACIPVSIAANSSVTVNILNGGSKPAASNRTTNDLLAQNFLITAVGAFNLSGTWNAYLNHGITNTNQSNSTQGNANNYSDAFTGANADIYEYGDGPCGKYLRIRASLEQSGSPHGFIEMEFFCMILQNVSGGLYGFRILPRMIPPWYDTSVTKQFAAFSTLQFYNGSTLVVDMLAGSNPAFGVGQTFTATSGNAALTTSSLNSLLGLYGSYRGQNLFCALSNSGGALPGGFFLNQAYWAQNVGNSTQFQITNTMGSGTVTPSSAGTGTQTVTPYPYISPFGSESFSQPNGMYNYIQGGGSVATDPAPRVQYDRIYWAQTGMLPPYLSTLTPTATPNPVPTKIWNIVYPFSTYQGATGGRPDIGLYTAYAANHVWTQSAADEQTVRVLALEGMTESYWLRSATYRTIPVCNNNTYSGMPPPNPDFQWDGSNENGITNPPATGVGTATSQVWTGNDFSHKPEFTGYAYLLTGEVDKLDHLMQMVSGALMNLYPGPTTGSGLGVAVANSTQNDIGGVRNSSIDSIAYYGHLTGGQQGRTSAWSLRYVTLAQVLGGSHPENPNYSQYATDVGATTISAWASFMAIQPSFVTANSIFNIWNNTSTASWQVQAYLGASLCYRYATTKDANTLTRLNYIMAWPATWYSQWGNYSFPYYEQLTKIGLNGNQAPVITSLGQVGVSDLGNDVSWTTSQFTLQTALSGNYVLSNGDSIIFDADYVVPGGFTAGVEYFVISATGSGVGATFKLTTVKGNAGDIVNPTNTGSGACYFQMNTPQPSTGFLLGSGGTENYSTIIPTVMQYANFIGGTLNSAMYADMQARFNFYNVNFTTEAQWNFTTTQTPTLSAAVGTFALTGEAVSFVAKRSLSVAHGSFTLTGEAVTFFSPHNYGMTASLGTFALTGEAITANSKRSLSVAHASFALTGEAITFGPHYTLSPAYGSFSFTGEAVTFPGNTITLSVAHGSFTFTGEAATLNKRLKLFPVGYGSYHYEGTQAYFQLKRGQGYAGSFNWTQTWAYSPWQNKFVDYVAYTIVNKVMLVAWRSGLQQLYSPIAQTTVAQVNDIVQSGQNPTRYLAGLPKIS